MKKKSELVADFQARFKNIIGQFKVISGYEVSNKLYIFVEVPTDSDLFILACLNSPSAWSLANEASPRQMAFPFHALNH